MFGRKRKAADKPVKKEAKVVKKEVKAEVKVEAPQPIQGLSGRELNRALRGKTPQRVRARGRE